MCYAVYLGTSEPLHTSGWNEDTKAVYVAAPSEKDEPVRAWFTKPHIYYVGSHLQCGCGFFHNGLVFTDDAEMMRAYEASQSSVRSLVAILEQALTTSDAVEMFVTWEGRQSEPPMRRRDMCPKDLMTGLQRYSEDADGAVQIAESAVREQEFIVMRGQA
jgi:hypothetical protein